MDVHPTKNLSIGIDPYPNEGKKNSQFCRDFTQKNPGLKGSDPKINSENGWESGKCEETSPSKREEFG